jgi:two-component system KDP operon response regulator KdpE
MSEPGPSVLVIDDEGAIRRFLQASLAARGCTVFQAASGREGLEAVMAKRPDLIILDLGLPDIEGIDVIRQLREWSPIPIIILSVREHEADKINALDAGADDYLTKPFSVGELMARLRAALRRANHPSSEPVFSTGELKVDLVGRVVTLVDHEVQLTPTEYDLLKLFITNAGKVLTHQQILRQVWGVGYADDLHLLRVNVSNLRRKIEPNPSRPRYIVTEPGVGYRLRLDAY